MITAAAAVMVSGAFAINEAQVYDFSATVKSGVCQETKVSKALATYFNTLRLFPSQEYLNWAQGDEIGIRKQKSQKLAGVIWGCDCETIADPKWGPVRLGSPYLRGYMFWNETAVSDEDTKGMLYIPWTFFARYTTFRWTVLNRIDTMTKCEGAFALTCRFPNQQLFLQGAGFGTVAETGCDTYIKSINGNIAGFTIPATDRFGCVYCSANGCVVAPICDTCWEWDTRILSAATGTWKLKYNKSVTKKLRTTPYISRVYKFGKKSGYAQQFADFAERLWAWMRANGLAFDQNDWPEKTQEKYEEFIESVDYVADDFIAAMDGLADEAEDPDSTLNKQVLNYTTRSVVESVTETFDVDPEEQEEAYIAFETAIAKIVGDLS